MKKQILTVIAILALTIGNLLPLSAIPLNIQMDGGVTAVIQDRNSNMIYQVQLQEDGHKNKTLELSLKVFVYDNSGTAVYSVETNDTFIEIPDLKLKGELTIILAVGNTVYTLQG